jgi:hypothetical protein
LAPRGGKADSYTAAMQSISMSKGPGDAGTQAKIRAGDDRLVRQLCAYLTSETGPMSNNPEAFDIACIDMAPCLLLADNQM